MRHSILAAAFGAIALGLVVSAAFADERDWRYDRPEWRGGYRHDDRREIRRDEWRLVRDREQLGHELREGDWRAAQWLRWKIAREVDDLRRDRWQGGYR